MDDYYFTRNSLFDFAERFYSIGGRSKGFKQIANIDNSYVLADDLEIGFGNKIPLWLIGMMY